MPRTIGEALQGRLSHLLGAAATLAKQDTVLVGAATELLSTTGRMKLRGMTASDVNEKALIGSLGLALVRKDTLPADLDTFPHASPN